ncbi:MAG: DUF4260 domain-containing protein [Anaerolineales bacterium]
MGFTQPKILLHVEGGVLLTLVMFAFWMTQGNWWLFALLILAPDLAMVGYLAGPRVGAATYNAFHTYLLPGVFAVIGLLTGSALPLHIALIWFAHIGGDRMLGYGLKYTTAFKDTHLQRV